MGQQVQAIVYGVFENVSHCNLFNEDGDLIEGTLDGRPDFGRIERGDGSTRVIGFAIAVSNVWEEDDGEVEIPECRVDEIGEFLKPQVKGAKKRWTMLSKWAKSKGVEIGKPELLLVKVERA